MISFDSLFFTKNFVTDETNKETGEYSIMRLLLIIICISATHSQMKLDSIDQKVLNLTYNDEFAQSNALLVSMRKQNPLNPKYFFFQALVSYEQLFGNDNKSSSDSLRRSIEYNTKKAITLCEEADKAIDITFIKGVSYGYLARSYASGGSWFKAFKAGRKGKSYLEDVVDENPMYYDAYIGIGMYYYYAEVKSTLINVFQWLFGISGDKEKGIELMEKAKQGKASYPPSLKFLAQIYEKDQLNYSRSLENVNLFLTSFPKNNYMTKLKKELLLLQSISNHDIKLDSINEFELKNIFNKPNILNNLGYKYLENDDPYTAVRVFPDDANAYDSLGDGYKATGNKVLAEKYYSLSIQKGF